jgi:hypothetical protein
MQCVADSIVCSLTRPIIQITAVVSWLLYSQYKTCFKLAEDRDGVGGVATRYGLNGPGIKSRGVRDFPYQSITALGPNQPLIQWVPGLFPGDKAAGVWR